MKRYPGRFNVFGYAVWSGGPIYDGVHHGRGMDGLPQILRPKVYQGLVRIGREFQSLYQPFPNAWWFQIFTAFEWQVASNVV